MPDTFDSNGLIVAQSPELVADFTNDMQLIYGNDINVGSNSPDGQLINIVSQFGTDLREFLLSLVSSFDPDQAQGVILDQRVAINNIVRQGGTYTIVPVSITVSQPVTLQGLDANIQDPNGTGFTISDSSGNNYILINTTSFTAGTSTAYFRAQNVGQVEVLSNSLTNIVTYVLGVASVNNPTGPTQVGQDQETDMELKIRRTKSTSVNSQGFIDGLVASLLALPNVSNASVYQNTGSSVDSNGIPAHGIWVIVNGGSSSDIVNTMYAYNTGCSMKGSQSGSVTTVSGDVEIMYYDTPAEVDLYVKANIKTLSPNIAGGISVSQIQTNLATIMATYYTMGQYASTSEITTNLIQAIASTTNYAIPIDVFISLDGTTWTDYIPAPSLNSQFSVQTENMTFTVE